MSQLTRRERAVLGPLAEGLDNKGIAERRSISPETAREHVVKMLSESHFESRLRAAIFAIRHGVSLLS